MKKRDLLWISLSCISIMCSPPAVHRETQTAEELAADTTQTAPAVEPEVDSSEIRRGTLIEKTKAIPIEDWPGNTFVLVPKGRMFQKFGYHLYDTPLLDEETQPADTTAVLKNHRLKYDRYKLARITALTATPQSDGEYLLSFQVDSPSVEPSVVYGKTSNGTIEGIALASDLAHARDYWLGDTIYSRRRILDRYDSSEAKFSSMGVSISAPLLVVDVHWGMIPLPPKPIWLEVESPTGPSGIIPIHFSWTNVLESKRTEGLPWEEDVLEDDPRKAEDWPDEIWTSIDAHRVMTGMTKEQVKMAWGEPISVDTASEDSQVWKFDRGTVRFVGDTLTAAK